MILITKKGVAINMVNICTVGFISNKDKEGKSLAINGQEVAFESTEECANVYNQIVSYMKISTHENVMDMRLEN